MNPCVLKQLLYFLLFPLVVVSLNCSRMKLAYNYADWFLEYRIQQYIDLTDTQEEWVEREIDSFLVWHRQNELPKYAAYLKRGAKLVKDRQIDKESVSSLLLEFQTLYRSTLTPLLPKISQLLSQLSKKQIKGLKEKFQEKFQEDVDEVNRIVNEQVKKRADRTLKTLQEWTGPLKKEQKRQIRHLSFQLPVTRRGWIESRYEAQMRLIETIENSKTPQSISHFLEQWLLSPEQFHARRYQEIRQESQKASAKMMLDVSQLLNEKQYRRVEQRLLNMAEDFIELSAAL